MKRQLPWAQFKLGLLYAVGKGVPQKSGRLAHLLFWKAAVQAHAGAQYMMAIDHMDGTGVDRDDEMAFQWCTAAAEQGYKDAQHRLSTFYYEGIGMDGKDPVLAFAWSLRAANRNTQRRRTTSAGAIRTVTAWAVACRRRSSGTPSPPRMAIRLLR